MTSVKDDLTGAALVALMRLSFAEQRIRLPDDAPPAIPNRVHASLSAKNRLAEAVFAQHGPKPLLAVGRSIPRMAFDPIGAALLAANDGPDLFGRWARLERYVHLRHPIAFREMMATQAQLAHFGDPDDPPSPAMDFVLAGVLAGLLTAVGCRDLTLVMGDGDRSLCVIRENQAIEITALPAPTGLWSFSWREGEREPATAGLMMSGSGRAAREAARIIEADLVAIWSLNRLAARLGLSTRTLQRRLRAEGWSLQSLRRAAQIRRSTAMLIEGKASLSTIGFVCGFSDPAHFARAYRQATGMSPGAYRSALG